jgi:hypothetical protein
MQFEVKLTVEVDVDGWQVEYGTATITEALMDVLTDLREPGWYLQGEKWKGLGTVTAVEAQLNLFPRQTHRPSADQPVASFTVPAPPL